MSIAWKTVYFDYMVGKRILIDLLGVLLVVFMPWYISMPFIILLILVWGWYADAIFLALMTDFLFNPSLHAEFLFPFFNTAVVVAASALWFVIKRRFLFAQS